MDGDDASRVRKKNVQVLQGARCRLRRENSRITGMSILRGCALFVTNMRTGSLGVPQHSLTYVSER